MRSRVASGLDGKIRGLVPRMVMGITIGFAALFAMSAGAETAWVKDQVRLNLRSGPGTKYRIIEGIGTGDQIEVLTRAEGWTQVRTETNKGWIPEGFLQAEAPAAIRLERLEAQTADVRVTIDKLTTRAAELETENAALSKSETSQNTQIGLLTRENLELKAGARWPEWITGAGILAVGMLMGAILQSVSGRRARPRIRL